MPDAAPFPLLDAHPQECRIISTPSYDTDKVDEADLALLALTLHDRDEFGARAWKGHDWDARDRLHQKGLIQNLRSKAKSVARSADAVGQAEEGFQRLFGTSPAK